MKEMKSITLTQINDFSANPGILYLASRKQMLDSFKKRWQ